MPLAVAAALAGVLLTPAMQERRAGTASRYLFVWTGDADRQHDDFLAVLDVAPQAPSYGRVVRTVRVGAKGLRPHHTEHFWTPGRSLFANGFAGNRTFRFDVRDPLNPRLAGEVRNPESLAFPHSFERLPNGHLLATMQARDDAYAAPGGLAEFDDTGRVLRVSSAASEGYDQSVLRPYSLAVLPERDRVITGSALMGLPPEHPAQLPAGHDHRGFHLQLWRLSDLRLLKTIVMPVQPGAQVHLQPAEPRRLPTGDVLVSTMANCGLYRVTGFDAETFGVDFVHAFGSGQCAVPVVVGHYWVMPLGRDKRVVSLDVEDSRRPRTVSSVQFDAQQFPHWLSYDSIGHRIIVVNSQGERRVWMVTIDPASGALSLDEHFRDEGSDRPGVSFERESWPHGNTGSAIPHGSVFAR